MHLPLNAIDTKNRPPLWFLWTQDGMNLACGGLWSTAYILYIRQSFRDESYGMPILALCANIAWELIYGVFYPPGLAETIAFLPWVFIDLVLFYATVKFGPKEWERAPLVARNLLAIIAIGFAMMLAAHGTFIQLFDDPGVACFWAGYACQVVVSWSSIWQLVSRGSTRGHSKGIWLLRWLGTLCATGVLQWRYYHYPEDYSFVGTPFATFLFAAPELADLAYPFLFSHLKRQEKRKAS